MTLDRMLSSRKAALRQIVRDELLQLRRLGSDRRIASALLSILRRGALASAAATAASAAKPIPEAGL